MERFLNPWFYFAPLPDPNFQFSKLTLGLGLLLIAAGILSHYYRKKKITDVIAKKILRPYPGRFITYGVLLLFLLGAREMGIPYVSMRIWWFVILGFFLYTFLGLTINYRKDYAKRARRLNQNESKGKYLPKKKN
ncbi:MAG: hypothetical protein OEY44_02120 [Candidatus Peregrinibacteria bacterium]|nr:hypothetical protein [Candidatus Peregrinibacteria bacterium]